MFEESNTDSCFDAASHYLDSGFILNLARTRVNDEQFDLVATEAYNTMNRINLSKNNITSIFSVRYLSRTPVQEISLKSNFIDNLDEVILPDNLRKLDLSDNFIGSKFNQSLQEEELEISEELRELNLSNNRLSSYETSEGDFGLKFLFNSDSISLNDLNVSGNNLTTLNFLKDFKDHPRALNFTSSSDLFDGNNILPENCPVEDVPDTIKSLCESYKFRF